MLLSGECRSPAESISRAGKYMCSSCGCNKWFKGVIGINRESELDGPPIYVRPGSMNPGVAEAAVAAGGGFERFDGAPVGFDEMGDHKLGDPVAAFYCE